MSLTKVYEPDNLRRAWRWIRANPDAQHKAYFRDAYKAYALADEAYLASLRERLRTGTFRPSHSTKLYLPKASGLLRTYTLLNLEDQIAYQAMVNVVAERLFPHVQHRYGREVFGHLYAGKSSIWFYRKWSTGYKLFNAHIESAIRNGFVYTATFDLTAFYDSVAHGVLRYFLERLGLGRDFSDQLIGWLEIWTAGGERIYHSHGIPQGPLPSGLLSEAVLQYFDSKKRLARNIRYFRYVDDIRLYSKDTRSLRETLISFDYLSKFLGLFPQASKMELREVKDVSEELKSISRSPEADLSARRVNQKRIRQRLVRLSPRYTVSNSTRFKFVLAHGLPEAHLSLRLLRILTAQPVLYDAVFRYFSRYQLISSRVAGELLKHLRDGHPYFSYKAALLQGACGRIHPRYQWRFNHLVKEMWEKRRKFKHATDLRQALLAWLLQQRMLDFRQVRSILCGDVVEPWLRSHAMFGVERNVFGDASYEALLNTLLSSQHTDVAISASYLLIREGLPIRRKVREINYVAAQGLRSLGLVRGRTKKPSLITTSLSSFLPRDLPAFDWRGALRGVHASVERQAILSAAYAKTDMNALVNTLDVLNDRLLDALARHDVTIGTYQLGNIGSFLGSRTSAFATRYPVFFESCTDVHDLRKKSDLSHAIVRGSGKATGRIRFGRLPRLRWTLFHGYTELIRKW